MSSHVYLFFFRNDYEISGKTVFLSFILKNFTLFIKRNGKLNLHQFNRIIYHLSISSKLKTCFSQKENLKKCTGFEEQKGISYVWGNVYFDFIDLSSLSSTKPCLEFLLICLAWEIKGKEMAFIRFHEEMRLISWIWFTFPQKSWLQIKISKKWDMVL